MVFFKGSVTVPAIPCNVFQAAGHGWNQQPNDGAVSPTASRHGSGNQETVVHYYG